MLKLVDAVYILIVVVVACLLVALGAYLGNKLTLGKLAHNMGGVALVATILYAIYTIVVIMTKNTA